MQFILSIAMTFVFSLTLLQCDKARLANNSTAKNDKTSAVTAEKTTTPAQTQTPDDGAPRIALAEAKADYDAGNAIIIDARDAGSYKNEHIKGSINIPLADFEAQYKDKKIPTGKKLIVYCSWPSEHTSASWVLRYKEKGGTNAYALLGGTKAWRDAGYPMEASK